MTKNGYEANGLHGQFIYFSPLKYVIIVRLGKRSEKFPWESLFDQLAERL